MSSKTKQFYAAVEVKAFYLKLIENNKIVSGLFADQAKQSNLHDDATSVQESRKLSLGIPGATSGALARVSITSSTSWSSNP